MVSSTFPDLPEVRQEKADIDHVPRAVGNNVRALRSALKLSQEELAFRAGLDRSYMSLIERGQGNPSVLTLAKISRALGVTLGELFSYDQTS